MPTLAVILATGPDAGQPWALQPVLGDPALLWVLRALPSCVASALVVGPGSLVPALATWKDLLPCATVLAEPEAMDAELDRLGAERVLLVPADHPLLRTSTMERLCAHPSAALAGDEGVRILPREALRGRSLGDLPAAAAHREPCEPEERMALASRRDQAALQRAARERINGAWLDAGVGFLDEASTFVGPRVILTRDVILEPCVRLEGAVEVGAGTRIGQGSVIHDARIGAGAEIRPYCVVRASSLGDGVQLGPFAHLREGSVLEAKVHVGNFVETKKALLREGAKANHLSYLGDAEVGERTNIGAGFISCNYDGFGKHRTLIGRDVFVGSDCQLVAPVAVGDGAILGAGSTITQDVPAQALALTRAPLVLKEGGANRLREKLRARSGKS